MPAGETAEAIRARHWVALYRKRNPVANRWAAGYGPIQHTVETQARVFAMAEMLATQGVRGDGVPLFDVLYAADRVTSAALWLVAHQTYAQNVYLDGRDLSAEDFKPTPEGHTGGALNIVPGYVGYMAINAITGHTRSWVMGQGHAVSAIDSVNLLLNNMTPAHAERYSLSDAGLTRYVRDFYSYALRPDGELESPLGSHVNVYTGGGLAEGGYLGFMALQYVHMPLPGERLVTFLSDGAFEEQRGSDWAPRWWRAEDSGLVAPIMIDNGRRIDQRTQMRQAGGVDWFAAHLKLNGFDPIPFDGRDPAAFAWAVFEIESRLEAAAEAIRSQGEQYPIELPYGIATAPKGAGFYGEGTNEAHNLPLGSNPHTDAVAAQHFNESARRIWVPMVQLSDAIRKLQYHETSQRPKERDHPLACRDVRLREIPALVTRKVSVDRRDPSRWLRVSPMQAVDLTFLSIVQANPGLRPRAGNPDEFRSNRMLRTLEVLKFRVTEVEPGAPEAIDGAVITSLNEEAVCSAALANKGGINIVVTYEAFADKMHGALRQEVIWANHGNERGVPQGWLSVPVILTSHTWENGKNELSHQDPVLAETMLGEPSDVSRVLFAADFNTAAVVMQGVYQTRGQIWTVIVPKQDPVPVLFTPEEAAQLLAQGALRLDWAGHAQEEQRLVLTAVGAYQLEEVLKASFRLAERNVPHSVVYMIEPGKFRRPRSRGEQAHLAPAALTAELYPDSAPSRVFVTHTRPEPLLGALQPLWTGGDRTGALGFVNHGGTLNVSGLLSVNHCTAPYILAEAARVLDLPQEDLFSGEELFALQAESREKAPVA